MSGDGPFLWFSDKGPARSFFDAELPAGMSLTAPAWWRDLSFQDPRALPASAWGRSHDDIMARWLVTR